MTWSREKIEKVLARFLRANSQPQDDKGHIIAEVMPFLRAMNLQITVYENHGNPAIFASTPDPKIMLSGHLDTVKIDPETTTEPGQMDGDIMYGRGSLDMKGPCVAMLAAAENMIREGHGVALAFTTDEEVGMEGARVIARHNPQIADIPLVVICEPTAMVPIIEEKGLLQLHIRVEGKAAHASMPESGISALNAMINGLAELQNSHPIGKVSTDPVSLNIGKLNGGILINMIASHAEAEIDFRFSPDFTKEALAARVSEIMEKHANNAKITIDEIQNLPPVRAELPPEVKAGLEEWQAPSGKVPYATEMAVFGLINPRCFILGPGQVDVAHTKDEWMSIPELMRAIDLWSKIPELL